MPGEAQASVVENIEDAAARVAEFAREQGRADIADDLEEHVQRSESTPISLVLVGAVSKGKSSLVNALLGDEILPTDPDVATQAHVQITYAPKFTARSLDSGEELPVGSADELWESWQPTRSPQPIEIGLPNPLLEQGLVLVDTPGIGGLAPAHDALTSAVAAAADTALLVIDPSGPLTKTELDYFETVVARVTAAGAVMTKTDAFPSWEQISKEDQKLLARRSEKLRGIEIVPVSPQMRMRSMEMAAAGREAVASALAEDSNFSELEDFLTRQVIGKAVWLRRANLLAITRHAISTLITLDRAEEGDGDSEAEEQTEAAKEGLIELNRQRHTWAQASVETQQVIARSLAKRCNRATRDMQTIWQAEIDNRKSVEDREEIAEELEEQLNAKALELASVLEEEAEKRIGKVLGEMGYDAAAFDPGRSATPLSAVVVPPPPTPSIPDYMTGHSSVTNAREKVMYIGIGARMAPLLGVSMIGGPVTMIIGGAVGLAAAFFGKAEREKKIREQVSRQALKSFVSTAIVDAFSLDIRYALEDGLAELRKGADTRFGELLEGRERELQRVIETHKEARQRSADERARRKQAARERLGVLREIEEKVDREEQELSEALAG